jgi:tRNA(Leu) C34 or U34 (ribose-2'-O)-methylase TrmL
MPLKWHSVEQELTVRCAEGDWGGALRFETEAKQAAKALVDQWPEASLRIYNMLSDALKALGDNGNALVMLQLSEAVAKEGANR